MNKKILITIVAVSILGTVGLFTASKTFAQSNTNNSSSLVQVIAEKFGLKKDEVQAVFDQQYEKRHTQMQAKLEVKLSQYVSDGKITEEQKQLILSKHKELATQRQANKESMQNLTPEERKTQMVAKKAELEAWAKQNGIDPQYFMGGIGKKGFGGRIK